MLPKAVNMNVQYLIMMFLIIVEWLEFMNLRHQVLAQTATVEYTVAEVIPEDVDENNKKDGYTYDSNTFEVTVTLTDNKKGDITAEADKTKKDLTFKNTYEATGELDFSGLKTLERGDLADKEFEFELIQIKERLILPDEEEVIQTVKVGGEDYEGDETSAEFNFETITFTKDKDGDDCDEYTYKIREVVPDDAVAQFTDEDGNVTAVKYKDATDEQKETGKFILGNYQYDSIVHEITVTVTDNGDGTLEVTKDPEAVDYDAKFTNTKAYTDLEITKDLRAFVDTNAEEITLAFEITGKTPEGKDYRAAAGLTFNKEEVLAGKPKTVTVEKVPTGTTITVKEVYASNFKPEGNNPKTATLNKDGIYTVEFVDNYNNITYNTGAINKYTKNDDGGYDPPGKQASSEDSPGDQTEE